MRVILNVESLVKPSGGIGRYTGHLLQGLIKRQLIDASSCFVNGRFIDADEILGAADSDSAFGTNAGSGTAVEFVRSIPYVYSFYAGYKNLSFRYQVNKMKCSVYHEPNYILKPFGGPSVTTIHDLSHLHYPEHHPAERVRFLEKNLDATLNRADHVITDSEFVKRELVELVGADEGKITSIPLGVSDAFRTRSPEVLMRNLSRYGLQPGRYLLSVATLEPRKNITSVLDAYLMLDESLRQQYPLVLVGAGGWRNSGLKKRIDTLVTKGEVIYLGHVPEVDLPLVYAGARGFVYIPLYEGFGLPPLEAIASGVPALVSNVSSIPEVVGSDALLVNPLDIDAVRFNMEQLLEDAPWRSDAIAGGLNRSRLFSWDNTVDQTVDIYRRVDQ